MRPQKTIPDEIPWVYDPQISHSRVTLRTIIESWTLVEDGLLRSLNSGLKLAFSNTIKAILFIKVTPHQPYSHPPNYHPSKNASLSLHQANLQVLDMHSCLEKHQRPFQILQRVSVSAKNGDRTLQEPHRCLGWMLQVLHFSQALRIPQQTLFFFDVINLLVQQQIHLFSLQTHTTLSHSLLPVPCEVQWNRFEKKIFFPKSFFFSNQS